MKVKIQYSNVRQYQKKIRQKNPKQWIDQQVEQLAQEYQNQLKKRTPVGVYQTLRVGGVLRAGWKNPNIQGVKNRYHVTILNPVFYASFVNYGHRTPSGGFLFGRHMLLLTQEAFFLYDFPAWRRKIEAYLQQWMDHL